MGLGRWLYVCGLMGRASRRIPRVRVGPTGQRMDGTGGIGFRASSEIGLGAIYIDR